MSRFVLGNCIDVMTRIPDNAIDFILTDPPYLVGFRDRSGRTIAGDKTDEWLQPACNEMYRVLKKDALMVSFYGWNRVDRFMAAWKNAGFSVVGHLVFTKNYTSKAAYVGYRHECAYILAKGRPRLPQNPLPDVLGWKYSGNRHHPTEKPVTRNEGKQGPSLPYIPSGSFAKAMLIEGADANASVTGNESTVPMQLRITGLVEMPNSKTYDATGCFVGLEAWGDVSSERAIVRTRNISCLKDGKTIDMPIKGHVSFRGKNGIKGEVVMRNGKILGWAWGAGFVDGIGQGMERASQPAVGLGATAAYGAGDVLKMGIGGGASKAAQTLSDYYIKRAEQYHPVIPIGAGNEVTVVFQDGFQLKTVEEMALEYTQSRAEEENQESPVPVPPSAESHLNGFNTDQMLKQLGNLNPQQFMSGSQGGGNDGK